MVVRCTMMVKMATPREDDVVLELTLGNAAKSFPLLLTCEGMTLVISRYELKNALEALEKGGSAE